MTLHAQADSSLPATMSCTNICACTYTHACFFLWLYSPIQASAASTKLSVSLQLLDIKQSVGLLGSVISLSQGLCTQTLNINPLSGIQTHCSGICASKDSFIFTYSSVWKTNKILHNTKESMLYDGK
jgi:hypothetical protein